MNPVVLTAQDTEDGADLAAEAALVPEADPVTAGPGPIPDPSLTLPGTRRTRRSPIPVPDQDQDPGPSLSLDPEAIPLPPKEDPGLDLKASPSQQKTEVNPCRAQWISSRWTGELGQRDLNGFFLGTCFIKNIFRNVSGWKFYPLYQQIGQVFGCSSTPTVAHEPNVHSNTLFFLSLTRPPQRAFFNLQLWKCFFRNSSDGKTNLEFSPSQDAGSSLLMWSLSWGSMSS